MHRKLWIIGLAALLVIGGCEAFLRIAHPGGDAGQDQFTTNRIRLENYVDQNLRVDGVVVGSSLTARIAANAWPSGWRILSQAGGSALTGLEVISSVPAKPGSVLIEINTLDLEYRSEDARSVTAPGWKLMRSLLWFTRTANRPANLLVSHMRPFAGATIIEKPQPGFAAQLGLHRREYEREPGQALLQNLQRTKILADELRREGVAVVFFEMPVDGSLSELLRARRIRQAALSVFAPDAYCWRAVQDGQAWNTTDGIHLLAQDGRRAVSAILSAPCRTQGMNR